MHMDIRDGHQAINLKHLVLGMMAIIVSSYEKIHDKSVKFYMVKLNMSCVFLTIG